MAKNWSLRIVRYIGKVSFITLLLSILIGCKIKDQPPIVNYEPKYGDIKVEIISDSSLFGNTDQIYVDLKITNVSGRNVFVHKKVFQSPQRGMAEFQSIELWVTDPSGKELDFECTGPSRVPDEDLVVDFVSLSPWQSIVTPIGLGCFDLSIPGQYSVYAIYYNQYDLPNGTFAWKGSYKTNPILIEISE